MLGGEREGRGSPRAQAVADELVETVEHFAPSSNKQLTLYGQGITQVQVLDDNRELRLLESYQGVPLILWVILVGGGGADYILRLPGRDAAALAPPAVPHGTDRAYRPDPLHATIRSSTRLLAMYR